jgi:hypothetical protein
MSTMNDGATFRGFRNDLGTHVEVDGRPLHSHRSWYDHSDRFDWGYNGSGPAQLALAILGEVYRKKSLALNYHEEFKRRVVAKFPAEWTCTEREVCDMVDAILDSEPSAPERPPEPRVRHFRIGNRVRLTVAVADVPEELRDHCDLEVPGAAFVVGMAMARPTDRSGKKAGRSTAVGRVNKALNRLWALRAEWDGDDAGRWLLTPAHGRKFFRTEGEVQAFLACLREAESGTLVPHLPRGPGIARTSAQDGPAPGADRYALQIYMRAYHDPRLPKPPSQSK